MGEIINKKDFYEENIIFRRRDIEKYRSRKKKKNLLVLKLPIENHSVIIFFMIVELLFLNTLIFCNVKVEMPASNCRRCYAGRPAGTHSDREPPA